MNTQQSKTSQWDSAGARQGDFENGYEVFIGNLPFDITNVRQKSAQLTKSKSWNSLVK